MAIAEAFGKALRAVTREVAEDVRFSGDEFQEALQAHVSMQTDEDFAISNSFFSQNRLSNSTALGEVIARKRRHEILSRHHMPAPDFRER
jgi:hypothetical protein